MGGRRAVVVGAGIVGAGTAWRLARAGWDVTVVDAAAAPGQGSTSASSSIVRFTYSTWTGVATAWESALAWRQWGAHLGAGPEEHLARFHEIGGLLLDSPGYPTELVIDLMTRAGIEVEVWDAATLRERLPTVSAGAHFPPKPVTDDAFWDEPHGELGAIWTPHAGFIDDPAQTAVNLADAARRAGATFRFRTKVDAVLSGERASGVRLADGAEIGADVVVACAGPWSARLIELAGVGGDMTVGVRPMRQEVHHVPAPPGYTVEAPAPFIADPDLGTYLRPTPGGGLLVGSLEPACDPLQWLDDADDYDHNPTKELFDAQVLRAARRLPGLAVPDGPRGVVGVYDVSEDWTPIYDRTCLDGFYIACGTSGNQFKNAPVIGHLMAALIEAVEQGHDHDADPVRVPLTYSGHSADLGTYSRRRAISSDSTFSVLG